MANRKISLGGEGQRGFVLPNGVVITDDKVVVVTPAVMATLYTWIYQGLLVDGGDTNDEPTPPPYGHSGGDDDSAAGSDFPVITALSDPFQQGTFTMVTYTLDGPASANEWDPESVLLNDFYTWMSEHKEDFPDETSLYVAAVGAIYSDITPHISVLFRIIAERTRDLQASFYTLNYQLNVATYDAVQALDARIYALENPA